MPCHLVREPAASREPLRPGQPGVGDLVRKMPRASGSEHVARFRSATPPKARAEFAIVSPAKLSAGRASSTSAPSATTEPPRRWRRPCRLAVLGDDLKAGTRPSGRPAATAHVDVHARQVPLLESSRCFRSTTTMTCSTCHDVHAPQRDAASFSARCLTCHQVEGCRLFPGSEGMRSGHGLHRLPHAPLQETGKDHFPNPDGERDPAHGAQPPDRHLSGERCPLRAQFAFHPTSSPPGGAGLPIPTGRIWIESSVVFFPREDVGNHHHPIAWLHPFATQEVGKRVGNRLPRDPVLFPSRRARTPTRASMCRKNLSLGSSVNAYMGQRQARRAASAWGRRPLRVNTTMPASPSSWARTTADRRSRSLWVFRGSGGVVAALDSTDLDARPATRFMNWTHSSGYRPVVVSPESMMASAADHTAPAMSLTSALVGTGERIMDSSRCVARTITGLRCRMHASTIRFWIRGQVLHRDLDPEIAPRHHHRVWRRR